MEKTSSGNMDPIFQSSVSIDDDLDLAKIMRSGQCFRVKEIRDGLFRFIVGDKVLYIRQAESTSRDPKPTYEISCDKQTWNDVWVPYFDLGNNYSEVRRKAQRECQNSFLGEALRYGSGLRILNQDAWEMLVTFIISQRKNMPAIAKSVEMICVRFGEKVETPFETIHTFPSPEKLALATEDDLRQCSLGYRAPYVMDAVQKSLTGEIDARACETMDDEELLEHLQTIRGVGKKVANCICLFGYGRHSLAPIDVWIARAIDEHFGGHDPFPAFGSAAGIIQQYIFFYMTDRRTEAR